ncbi:MAG: gliding motility lipoprotein GldH [Bacteroidales bacterium]|nr:gliding motility lipoprotein GldH [Bacteroidales bacterium]
MKKTNILYGLTLFAAVLFAACNRNLYYADEKSVNEHGWLPTDTLRFEVEAADTTTVVDFLLEVRNTVDYPYANTFFFITTFFPDQSVAQDTLEFPLADPSGQWHGRRTGRLVDTRCYFRRNTRFPMQGTYTFAITNGMRDSAICGLKNVGLRIERSKH